MARARNAKSSKAKKGAGGRKKSGPAFPQHPEDDIDGCDIDFAAAEQTPDEELPPARGGVETSRRATRRS
jgi:hypothetical protein